MQQYLNLLQQVIDTGEYKEDRTDIGTISLFGAQLHFDISQNFPLLTTKKIHFKSVIYELLWMLKGDSNIQYLKDNGVSIWNEWADSDGNLGPVYGKQWRSWQGKNNQIDQIKRVIQQIKNNPESRRHIVSAWNPADIDKMNLPPCHILFQFYVSNGALSCQLYQRSADIFLGVPFNIASYSLLTYMVAHICHLKPYKFIWSGGDVHLYNNHIVQAKLQLSREILPPPQLKIVQNRDSIFDFQYQDFVVENYQAHPNIPAPVAV